MICRAKSLLTNKFVYGGFVQGKNAWIVQINSEGSFSHILVDPETVELLEPEKWIPVTEPPKEEGRYLCYFRYEPESPDVICENTYLRTHRWMSEKDKVTHWQPLPNLPKEYADEN